MSDTTPTSAETSSDLATLAIVYRFPEAAVLISMLRAYGIHAFAPAWGFVTIYWHLTVAIGGIAVLVPARDLEAAIALVGDPRELPPPPRNFRCGRVCNAVLALVLYLFAFAPPARARGSYAGARRRW